MAVDDRDRNISGTDITLDIYQDQAPIPQSDYASLSGEWLPKTDWSADRIIANDD